MRPFRNVEPLWAVSKLIIGLQIVLFDCFSFCSALFGSRTALVAENLFLRKQLALFQEREKKAKATTAADRLVFSKLARSSIGGTLW